MGVHIGVGSERSEEVIEEYWSELSECVGSFGRNELVVVLGDLNESVGNVGGDSWTAWSARKKMKVANDYWRCVLRRA